MEKNKEQENAQDENLAEDESPFLPKEEDNSNSSSETKKEYPKSSDDEKIEKKEEAEIRKDEPVKKEASSNMNKINAFLLRFSRVPVKEKLFFVQYLSIMIKSGISLSTALNTLSKQTQNKRFASIIKDISENTNRGISFTEALRAHDKVFGELFINMVEAGELSGKLEDVLGQLYTQMKKRHELTSKVKGALTYPAVIVVAMGGIGIFMMIMVVPKMMDMLDSFGAELPLATKILIAISRGINENGALIIAGIVVFIFASIKILQTYRGKYIFQAIVLKMPIISPIIKKINLANFARTVSSLLKTDIMIIKTFQITANVLGNLHYREAVVEMSDKIKKGSQINKIVSSYPKLFPPVVDQIISVGEETGELDTILGELAEFYEGEVDKIMENLPSIIEPLLILILGVGVGGMAVAIIMPMYTLTSAI